MSTNWRISSFNGALLAAYFVPTWTIVAFRIMVAPVHGLYERPNIAVGLFISDHLQLTGITAIRIAWLLALGKLTVVAFFVLFLAFIVRAAIRKAGAVDEPLAHRARHRQRDQFRQHADGVAGRRDPGASAACDRTADAARHRDRVAGRASRRSRSPIAKRGQTRSALDQSQLLNNR